MRISRNVLLFAVLGLLLPLGASAEIYKWVDEQGQTHYGEKPPAGQRSKQLQIDPGVATSPRAEKPDSSSNAGESRLERQQKLIRAMSEERQLKQEKREKAQRMEQQRIRNCANAKDNLRRYESSSSVYKVDDAGNRITLPGSERDKSIQRARAEVRKWCGS
ncbi:MAG: DUF4124 domain-containing protein [Gammaproteobacteria bacterium]